MKVDFKKEELIKRLIVLTPSLDAALEAVAKKWNVTKSYALRKILEAYFASEKL
jgi:predicted DNA-binding protein